jgi:hypothetical protein
LSGIRNLKPPTEVASMLPGGARDLEVDAGAEPYSRLLSKDCYSNVA